MPAPFVLAGRAPEDLQVWYYPLSGSPVEISQRIFNLRFSTVAPGGDAELTYSINLAGSPNTYFPQAGAAIGVWDTGGVVWCGVVEQPGGDYWAGAETLHIVCRGFVVTCSDEIYLVQKIFPQGTSIDTIFTTTASDLCPQINGGSPTTSRVLPEDSQDFVFTTAQSIWTTIAPLGGDGTPALWTVYSDIPGGNPATQFPRATLHVGAKNTAPSYHTTMATGAEAKLVGDRQLVRNRVSVKYTDKSQPSGYVVVTQQATGSQGTLNGIGAIRDLGFDMAGIDDTSNPNILAIAQSACNQALAQLATLQTTGHTITLRYPRSVGVPLWRVRAGNIMQIDDLNTGDSRIAASVYINATEWDEDTRTLTLTVGQRYGFVEAMGRAMRQRTPGRADTTNSTPVPDVARKVSDGTKYDQASGTGDSNKGTSYAPGGHSHGTPNGDLTLTWVVNNQPNVIVAGTNDVVGLVHGTAKTWKVRCDQGTVFFNVTLPNGTFQTQLVGDGAVGLINGTTGLKIDTNTEGTLTVQSVGGVAPKRASLVIYGTRNQS